MVRLLFVPGEPRRYPAYRLLDSFPVPTQPITMRIRFSLRSLLFVLTLATIICGWRLNQRRNSQNATEQILEQGGIVFFDWQEPKVIDFVNQIPEYTWSTPVTVALKDGSTSTKYIQKPTSRNRMIPAKVHQFYASTDNSDPPGFRTSEFLLGYHADVAVHAVSIDASSVNENTIRLMNQIHGLEKIMLRVDETYYSVDASNLICGDTRECLLESVGKDLRNAVDLIERHLPNVTIYKRGITEQIDVQDDFLHRKVND